MSRMRLEEVTDEYDLQQDDQYTDVSASDSESEIAEDDDHVPDETLFERISALRDIVPPPTRAKLSSIVGTGKTKIASLALFGGKSLWAITSSLLLLGIPFMMAIETEAQAQEEEKALAMQTSGNDALQPKQIGIQQPGPVQGVKPPGF